MGQSLKKGRPILIEVITMINESGYYLFRVEKVIESENLKQIETLYIIDFVVESDFVDFLSNQETLGVNIEEAIEKRVRELKSSHIFLRGIRENLEEDEVFQLSSKVVNLLFENSLDSKAFQELLNQYDIFYKLIIGVVDIYASGIDDRRDYKELVLEEDIIGKRKMTRKYSKAYNFISDRKLFRQG
ncbi:hypothetical protein [Exiguobacterium alkaliphilum]|uniref:Uncharacterized protein n=1 Tax=Exiguobacterium alkaliphilum TaxID=1428684 RepID=A0ABT2KZQ3_9BACL|nr:hypothetical protein [Exiguobacterium alkaliphilum]MCT4796399.1 hypothetical protein [Exiguobacterium alkaliphilum]